MKNKTNNLLNNYYNTSYLYLNSIFHLKAIRHYYKLLFIYILTGFD